jgi:hypothetical protein
MSRYGLSIDDYNCMVKKQKGRCTLCGKKPKGRGRAGYLVVDHDHTTNVVRGLLCTPCNSMLGFYETMKANPKTELYLKRVFKPSMTKDNDGQQK